MQTYFSFRVFYITNRIIMKLYALISLVLFQISLYLTNTLSSLIIKHILFLHYQNILCIHSIEVTLALILLIEIIMFVANKIFHVVSLCLNLSDINF